MQLLGFLIVFGCLLVGELVIGLTKLPLPPSIIGLLCLFALLSFKKVTLPQVQPLSQTMLTYLAFMVVSACISIMQYLDVVQQDGLAIVAGTVLSTLLVLWVTSSVHSLTRLYLKKHATNQSTDKSDGIDKHRIKTDLNDNATNDNATNDNAINKGINND